MQANERLMSSCIQIRISFDLKCGSTLMNIVDVQLGGGGGYMHATALYWMESELPNCIIISPVLLLNKILL